jgi:hypothetical protein
MEPSGELLLARGQAVGFVVPCEQKLSAGHVVQLALPLVDLYDPGLHGLHAEPSTPVNPARQVQLVGLAESAGAEVLAGHEFSMPVQHHVLTGQGWQAALSIPWYPLSQ